MTPTWLPIGRGARFLVDPEQRLVVTELRDGRQVVGTRDATHENIVEAHDQGYVGDGERAVWHSLAEHELMHTLVSRAFWDTESPVMLDLAGTRQSFAVRMHEEALVISLQHWLCTGQCDRVLDHVEAEVFEAALAARELLEPHL